MKLRKLFIQSNLYIRFIFISNLLGEIAYANSIKPSPQSIPINILLLLPNNNSYPFSTNKILPSLNFAIEELKTSDYGSAFAIKIIADNCDC